MLDNIDRIPEEEIEDYWSAVRSIFSKNQSFEKSKGHAEITAIVPYHRDHILTSDAAIGDDKQHNGGALARRELFSKTFDEILYVAPPVMSNTREFFEEKISEAIPNYTNKDELFRTYLIFSSNLSTGNGHFTPRQIIAFINELTGLFSMHQGLYALTTVAVYICFRERLERDPFELAKPEFVNPRLRRLAPDPDLEQNLAAILYNVDSQLALELLLDGRIASAATHVEVTTLVELSKSRGFELRVDKVIQDFQEEWVSSGQLGQVIKNFASLEAHYNGNATHQIAASLQRALNRVPSIALEKKEYEPYFGLLDMFGGADVSSILDEIVSKTFLNVPSGDDADFADGENWLDFLVALRVHLRENSAQERVENAVSSISLPSTPDFLLGCAYHSHDHGIPLKAYQHVKMSADLRYEDPLLTFSQKNNHLSYEAFSELISAKAVSADWWLAVGQDLIESMKDDESQGTEQLSRSLKTLVLIMHNLPEKERDELEIADLVGAFEFYAGFDKAFSDHPEDEGVAHALYLAHYVNKSGDLSITTGQASESSQEGFKLFKEQYDGKPVLSDCQLKLIAQHVFEDKKVTRWVKTGSAIGGHGLVDGVISAAFKNETVPFVSLPTFMAHFDYLRSVLGDAFSDTLQRFQERFDNKDIEAISLAEVPVGALSETQDIPGEGWMALHTSVGKKLQRIEAEQWNNHFVTRSHEAALLEEKAKTSGIEITQMAFRTEFQNFALGVLDGTVHETVHEFENDIDFDAVFSVIPESFHADLFRQCREKIAIATADGLAIAAERFPKFLQGMIRNGDRVKTAEKANIVRHILSTALEANNKTVLDMFLEFRRPKVARFIKASDDATKNLLSGSMENFRKLSTDHSYTREVSDLVNGKEQTKTLWNLWFTPASEADDEDDV